MFKVPEKFRVKLSGYAEGDATNGAFVIKLKHRAAVLARDAHVPATRTNKAQVASERSTETVNAKRATGVDVATVHGLSNKQHPMKLDPKHFHVFMKAVTSNGTNKRAK